jgi:hypothetical protein
MHVFCCCMVPYGAVVSIACVQARLAAPFAQLDCTVQGFSLRRMQVPITKSIHHIIGLYSLPYVEDRNRQSVPPKRLSSWQTAAAACRDQPECAMYTSDGYLISAYRISESPHNHNTSSPQAEADLFDWQAMMFCPSACCGTWVADDLVQQLLVPVPRPSRNATIGSMQNGLKVTSLYKTDYPKDSVETVLLDAEMRSTACNGMPFKNNNGQIMETVPAACGQTCYVACCKQLIGGNQLMGWHHFSQCSASSCLPCGFQTTRWGMAHSVNTFLLRPYLAEKSRGATTTPRP